jgi:hypothetical protein
MMNLRAAKQRLSPVYTARAFPKRLNVLRDSVITPTMHL